MNRLTLLIVTPLVPRPDVSAGDRRLFLLLQMLAADHRVDVLPLSTDADRPDRQAGYVAAVERLGCRVLPAGRPRSLERALLRTTYHAVVFEFWHAAFTRMEYVRRAQPWAAVVIDTVDVHYLREAAGAKHGAYDAARAARDAANERRAYGDADVVVAVTDDDAVELTRLHPGRRVVTIPLVIPTRPRNPTGEGRPLLSFIGGGKHRPNIDGIRWFVADIFPAIRAALPDATLEIAGAELPPEVTELSLVPGVTVLGAVPATEPCLDRAAVSVAPIRFGAGMKGKVAEAMGSGLPVVTTTVGAQGFGDVTDADLIVADDPVAFAAGVVRLLRDADLARRIGLAGQVRLDRICGPTAIGRQLAELIAALPASSPGVARFAFSRLKGVLRYAAKGVAGHLRSR